VNWQYALLATLMFLLAYTWAGYPALLWALRTLIRRPLHSACAVIPAISVIVAVRNEEAQIGAKLADCLALRYPEGKREIVVASDGSTDATDSIVEAWGQRHRCIRLVRTVGRGGKSGAQNLAAEQARGEILLFTDAGTRTRPDLLEQLAEDFADPRIGLVAPVVHFGRFDSAVSRSQNAYWRFELWLRRMESDLGILATASGAAFAIRHRLFRPIPPQFGDDCVVPLDVRLQGFRILQDERAIVCDEMPHSIQGEFRTRVRMTARNWSGILSRPRVLNPLRLPGTAWGLLSHKFLRWMTPFFLAGTFLLSAGLACGGRLMPLFVLQLIFYLAALIGWRRSRERSCARIFGYPFAFCLANLGFLLGVLRSILGERVVVYK